METKVPFLCQKTPLGNLAKYWYGQDGKGFAYSISYPTHQAMTTQAQLINNHNQAKKILAALNMRLLESEQTLRNSNNKREAIKEWSAAYHAYALAEEDFYAAKDLAYPQPDIEVTSSHVIVRRLGLSNLIKAEQIVKERHAVGDLKFTRVFRGEAARIARLEAADLDI